MRKGVGCKVKELKGGFALVFCAPAAMKGIAVCAGYVDFLKFVAELAQDFE